MSSTLIIQWIPMGIYPSWYFCNFADFAQDNPTFSPYYGRKADGSYSDESDEPNDDVRKRTLKKRTKWLQLQGGYVRQEEEDSDVGRKLEERFPPVMP